MRAQIPNPKTRLLSDLLIAGVVVALQALAWRVGLQLPLAHAGATVLVYAGLATILLLGAPEDLPGPGSGWANRVTLLRATLVLPVAALLVTPGSFGGSTAWAAVVVATLALALDGIDGAVARRTGTASAFGARFDMELDAFLILVLALLVWSSTPLGFWVVWIGLIRYAFVVAGWLWAPLRSDLPESFRRKAVCVVQVAVLLAALAPPTPSALAAVGCATALALLVYSFAVDILWLARRAPTPTAASAG